MFPFHWSSFFSVNSCSKILNDIYTIPIWCFCFDKLIKIWVIILPKLISFWFVLNIFFLNLTEVNQYFKSLTEMKIFTLYLGSEPFRGPIVYILKNVSVHFSGYSYTQQYCLITREFIKSGHWADNFDFFKQ